MSSYADHLDYLLELVNSGYRIYPPHSPRSLTPAMLEAMIAALDTASGRKP